MELLNRIGGESVAATTTLAETNPSTGELLHVIAASGTREVDAAVAAARGAFGPWAAMPAPARGEILFRAAQIIERDAAAIASAIVTEVGKPTKEAAGEVGRTAVILRYFAGEGRRAGGSFLPSDTADVTFTMREPLGVAALITPWNFPIAIPAWKAIPALIAGNSVVLKAAEQASHVASLLVDALTEAGVPAGVLNLVLGDGEAGQALSTHPGIDAISFTGSTPVGNLVRTAAAERGVRVQVEMGGKNVAIVLGDADLGRAAVAVANGAFAFAGQKCTATGICVVQRSVLDEFVAHLEKATAAITVGPPSADSTLCGPLIDQDAQRRAGSLGATTREGVGFFAAPTLLLDCASSDAECRDELFAPVLPVIAIDSLEEGLALGQALPTGLSSAIHTNHAPSIWRFLRDMRAGVLAVNRPTTGLEVQAPFGGLKESGSEHKEQGTTAIEFYTEIKTVYWS